MDLVLCHTTADFDTLGAAVGVTRLQPGARILLTGGTHLEVKRFLALHKDEFALVSHRAVDPEQIRSLTLVDAHDRDRVGLASEWIDQAVAKGIPITIYDHHPQAEAAIPAATVHSAPVGAATTLVAEALQAQQVQLSPAEATVMALGIHTDTGSLKYEHATPRDAIALSWLMAQGADQQVIAAATETTLSSELQQVLQQSLSHIHVEPAGSYQLGWLWAETERFIPGLASIASHLMAFLALDALLLGVCYPTRTGQPKLTLIGRSRDRQLDFARIFAEFGGGGHPQAASATVSDTDLPAAFDQALAQVRQQVPAAPTAQQLMSSPVRTVRPDATISDARRVLLRYGHTGLCVVNEADRLVGVISRRDLDLALHHGYGHAPVKGYMTTQVKTIAPTATLSELRDIMVTRDIGRLPVVKNDTLVGIVTRSDLLRQMHSDYRPSRQALTLKKSTKNTANTQPPTAPPTTQELHQRLAAGLSPALWQTLLKLAEAAVAQGWQLYLVGGAVRDLLLNPPTRPLQLKDIDLVVDGCHGSKGSSQDDGTGAGVALAQKIQAQDPQVEVQVHGQFQTAALVWPQGSELGPQLVDIATARTEFYAYPAANPEVEASSIRQDLYRRDFTINAMAVRLTPQQTGAPAGPQEQTGLLDFFGGWGDLQQRQIRVLHANSFIEDPTRIFRAVKFAVRLGFHLEAQTEQFIRYATASGIYQDLQRQGLPHRRLPALQTRLRGELQSLLTSPDWATALRQLSDLGAIACIHPDLALTPEVQRQVGRLDRWQRRFDVAQPWAQPWLLLLEGLLANLGPVAAEVAATLELPSSSQQRLAQLPSTEAQLLETLSAAARPSQVDHILAPLAPPLLLLLAARHPRPLGAKIWRYLLQLRPVSPPLDGTDLKQLGYRPGPQFRDLLAALRAATLDGEIGDRPSAIAFLQAHFPPNAPKNASDP